MKKHTSLIAPFIVLACSGGPAGSGEAPAADPAPEIPMGDGSPEANPGDHGASENANPTGASPGRAATPVPGGSSSGESSSTEPTSPEEQGPSPAEDPMQAEPSPGGAPEPVDVTPGSPSTGEGEEPTPEIVPPEATPEASGSELLERLSELQGLDREAFAEHTNVEFETLSHTPADAIGLDLIMDSALGLSETERARFDENGFVISTDTVFPHFSYGYQSIYGADLPVFISADSILYALHTSYDTVLKSIETHRLISDVLAVLERMRGNLAGSGFAETMQADLDVFLTVAHSLLTGEPQAPLSSANLATTTALYESCVAARGEEEVPLFGSDRLVDFSQCVPRGHYTDSAALSQYFRAMIWLGRIDFRMLEANATGELTFNRRQLEAALALRALMDDGARESHQRVDAIVTAFVGEHDSMTAPQLDQLMGDLGITSVAELDGLSDEALAEAIIAGGYGVQRISSHIMTGGLGGGTTPLPASFALFGQRYVIDSHVFSNLVFDRVKQGAMKRMMPNPLDIAYAALGNDHAGMLLASELERYDYASDLASMRAVVDSEPASFWQMNLYNLWLDALRTLSPARARHTEAGETLPALARTEAWGRRLLNTQLASWAELRHDTLLYAKQSYTGGSQCEFPDAYVDPYPEFFRTVASFAEHALRVMEEHGLPGEASGTSIDETVALSDLTDAKRAFTAMVEACRILGDMAEHQRTGAPHSEEHLAFVNRAVSISGGCGPPAATGWYGDLFIRNSVEWAPTIADVHTQPTNEGGATVGRVLHVGTGHIRLMVTSVETCSGPRAYAGLVSSYYERIEEDFERLTDPDWEAMLELDPPPASPEWLSPLLAE